MYQIIAAAVGAIIGGITNGVTTAVNTNKKVDALKKSAEQAYNLADEYSGTKLNRKMTEAGQRNAQELSRESLANQLNNYQPTTGNAMANVNNRSQFNSNYADFYNQGANREAQMANAAYNKGAADIERNLKQADIDYNVANQTSQAVMNGVGNVAGTIGDMGSFNKNNTATSNATSDERCKEPINNDSGLPRADIQDSLRQLESVKYKYTDEAQAADPNSTDDGTHVGSVTQSYEQTPLFKDAVVKDENGIGHMDIYKLNEALAAGLAEMQREIDELTGTANSSATSDERCKQAEDVIESNPVEAAQTLPQGTPIQKEAEQILDNDKRNDEVNNEVVDKTFKIGDKFKNFDDVRNFLGNRSYLSNEYIAEAMDDIDEPDGKYWPINWLWKSDKEADIRRYFDLLSDYLVEEYNRYNKGSNSDLKSYVEDRARRGRWKDFDYDVLTEDPISHEALNRVLKERDISIEPMRDISVDDYKAANPNWMKYMDMEIPKWRLEMISKEHKNEFIEDFLKNYIQALNYEDRIDWNDDDYPMDYEYRDYKNAVDYVNHMDEYYSDERTKKSDLPIRQTISGSEPDPLGINITDEERLNWNNGEDNKVSDTQLDEMKAAIASRTRPVIPGSSLIRNLEQAVEEAPEAIIEALPDSNAAKEAEQILNDDNKRNDEANNEKLEEDYKKYSKEEIDDALAEVNSINYDLIRGKGKKRTKEEDEELEKWIKEQEQKDQIEMNPGAFLPEPYKALATTKGNSVANVDNDNKDLSVVDDNDNNDGPIDVEYSIRDADEEAQLPIDYSDRKFVIPPLRGFKSNPKTFGYDRPNISAGSIKPTENKTKLGDNTHTVAGGSTTRPSFGGAGSSGGGVSTGNTISPKLPENKRPTPGRSFGGGKVNLVGSSTNPVASASASNGGTVTSGPVTRTSDPNMGKTGGHLSESRTQLPGGWVNNQGPAGGNLNISAGNDYQNKEAMTDKGSLLNAKLESILQEDSLTWDGNNSGDKYSPYIFFVGNIRGVQQFYVQKGKEQHAIKNVDPTEASQLIEILNSNNN